MSFSDYTLGLPSAVLLGRLGNDKAGACIQSAELVFEQRVDGVPVLANQRLDWIGATLLFGAAGLVSVLGQLDEYTNDGSVTKTYVIPGFMAAGAAAWIGYSFFGYPERPANRSEIKTWTEVSFVNATGCGEKRDQGVENANGVDVVSRPDTEERLKQLERVHAAGLLTDEEYQEKRKHSIDEL